MRFGSRASIDFPLLQTPRLLKKKRNPKGFFLDTITKPKGFISQAHSTRSHRENREEEEEAPCSTASHAMICAKSKKQMGFVILSLLLLTLLLLSTPCNAAGKAGFDRFGGGSSASELKSSRFHGGLTGNNADKHGDQIFGADKRKVYTGPNPLHNR